MISQHFNDRPTLASVMFVIICAILILGAVLTYILLRQVSQHGRILAVHNQGLDLLTAQLGAIWSHRSQIE